MFSVKIVTTYPDTQQVQETVFEVNKYNITRHGHGTITVDFVHDKHTAVHLLSKIQNEKDGIFEQVIFVTNSHGKTIDTLRPKDTFDPLDTKEEHDAKFKAKRAIRTG